MTSHIAAGILSLTLALGLVVPRSAAVQGPRAGDGPGLETRVPPAPWAQQDPADSLYRAARQALNAGDYREASGLFRRIVDKYPRSTYARDALYWAAYAGYRLGSTDDLRLALEGLREQQRRYPDAATRGDAQALEVRIQGELARRGDADAAAAVASRADVARAELQPAPAARAEGARGVGGVVRSEASAAAEVARERAVEAQVSSAAIARAAASADIVRSGQGIGRNRLPPGCEDQADDYEIRSAALNALMQMDADRALPVLKQVIAKQDKCSAPLRRTALFLVGQSDSPEAADILVNAVRNDPDPDVRRTAVTFLAQVKSDRAIPALQEILRTSKDEDMQAQALFALSQQDAPQAGQILRDYASRGDISSELRGRAIFFLAQQRSPGNAAFLRELFGKTTDEQVQERILFALSQMDGQDTGPWLLDIATDTKRPIELRKKALFFAGQQRDGLSTERLAALYDRLPDAQMRKQVIFVLSQRDGKAAVDKMIDIARNEKDPELRKAAIFWLGQSDDPRAVQVLQEIINH